MNNRIKMDVHNGRMFLIHLDEQIEYIKEKKSKWISTFDELNSLVRGTEVNSEIQRLQIAISDYVSKLLELVNKLHDFTEKQLLSYCNAYEKAKALMESVVESVEHLYSTMKERGL